MFYLAHEGAQVTAVSPESDNSETNSNTSVPLKHNEVFGSRAGHRLPITCHSGADITVVPEECVDSDHFTGETCAVAAFNKIKTVGKLCDIQVQVGDHVFKRRAVTQPGEAIS